MKNIEQWIKVFINSLPYLPAADGSCLFLISQTVNNLLLQKKWEYDTEPKYHIIRDYLILKSLQENSQLNLNLNKNKIEMLNLFKEIAQNEYKKISSREKNAIWNHLLASIDQFNRKNEEKSINFIKEELGKRFNSSSQSDNLCQKLHQMLKERTHLVLSFNTSKVFLFLMLSRPGITEKISNQNYWYLYKEDKEDVEKFYYKINENAEKQYLELREDTKAALKKAVFNQNIGMLTTCNNKQIREAVFAETSKKGHTPPKLNIQCENILNYFQRGIFLNKEYILKRFSVETALFINPEIDISILQALLRYRDTHPIYASLQFCVEPIELFGKSFIVLNPILKESAIAIFSDSFIKTNDGTNFGVHPVRLSSSLFPLIAQFSPELLSACLQFCQGGHFPENFNIQHNDKQTSYIEVQIFSDLLQLDNPAHVSHIHLDYFDLSNFPRINHLIDKGITVSGYVNPYRSPEAQCSMLAVDINKILIEKTLDYIYSAALIIAETDSQHLKFVPDEKRLTFSLNVSINAPQLHQAQAAALLYLLGVRRFFNAESRSAINFLGFEEPLKKIDYHLTLDGCSYESDQLNAQEDAYVYTYSSLRKLLLKLLNRIFLVYLVSMQNEEQYLTQNKSNKGATAKSNQIKPLTLQPLTAGNDQWTINTYCAYDFLVIEAPSEEAAIWITKQLNKNPEFAVESTGCFINTYDPHIASTPDQILKQLRKNYFPYQACVIYDDSTDVDNGNVWLAFRRGRGLSRGFTTPGGHNHDPYSWSSIFTDIEFGQVEQDSKKINNKKQFLGSTKNPNTLYYSLPSSCLSQIKLETREFESMSLRSIPFWRLGCLNTEEIKLCVRVLETTPDDYEEHFHGALPLRPVPSLIIYLDWAEKKLTELFKKLLFDTVKIDIVINKGFEDVFFKDVKYWKPNVSFGHIKIDAEPNILLNLQKSLQKSDQDIKAYGGHTLQNDSKALVLERTNPFALMRILEDMLSNAYATCTDLIPLILEKLKMNQFSYLMNQHDLIQVGGFLMTAFQSTDGIAAYLEWDGEIFLYKLMNQRSSTEKILDLFSKGSWTPLQRTSLHIAVQNKDLDAVMYLSEKKEIPIGVDKNGDTPMHYACMFGHLPSLQYLIEKKDANLFCRNTQKQSLWFVALLKGNWNIIEFLTSRLDTPASWRQSDSKEMKKDLLTEAQTEEKQQSILHLLISFHEKPNFTGIFLKLLGLFGTCVNFWNAHNMTVLDLVMWNGLSDLIPTLKTDCKAKANIFREVKVFERWSLIPNKRLVRKPGARITSLSNN